MNAYLAADGYLEELREELGGAVVSVHGRLVLAETGREAAWAANTWFEPQEIAIRSITDAARRLGAVQRNWTLYAFTLHRRAALIQAALPPVRARPLVFPAPPPSAPLGSWTLLARDRLLAAPRCASPFPHGEAAFVEDRLGPPNRAYLKLWELFTRLGARPAPGDLCVDLGASPGGWTWVLAGLGARVVAVDKAPLDPRVAALPGVRECRASAFGLEPFRVDWMFCDVVCYPGRLFALVRRWRPYARSLVCTIKFQGPTDHEAARAFQAVPGSRLMHLHHNRRELTWVLLEGAGGGGQGSA